MPFIMKRFKATYVGPVRKGPLTWVWTKKGGQGGYVKLTFRASTRRFQAGEYVTKRGSVVHAHDLSEKATEKLRFMLPDEAVAECARAALGAS